MVKNLAGSARKHSQSAYAGMQNSLQQEWAFVQQATLGIGDAFVPVEKALQETFVPDLFEGLGKGAPERGPPPASKKGSIGPSRPNLDGP